MKRTHSYTLYAFIIAFLVHLILVLLLIILTLFAPKPTEKPQPPQEQRFKLSIKERPHAQKEALVKNEIPKISKARPIPQGEQLAKPTPPAPKPQPPIQQPAPEPTPTEPKKAFERHIAKTVATIEREPAKPKGLYEILSKPDTNVKSSLDSNKKVNSNIQELYGEKFGELSEGEQKYIIDNIEIMHRITQKTYERVVPTMLSNNFPSDSCLIEFYLYPDRSISDIRFIKSGKFEIFNETARKTIEYSFGQYPRPTQRVLIRYQVIYGAQ